MFFFQPFLINSFKQAHFFNINKKDFKIVCYSTLSGNYLKVTDYQFDKGSFYLETLHEPNNWVAIAKFFRIDDNTLVADYVCDSPGQVIYKRVINTNQ